MCFALFCLCSSLHTIADQLSYSKREIKKLNSMYCTSMLSGQSGTANCIVPVVCQCEVKEAAMT
jgi:hypothetical protein